MFFLGCPYDLLFPSTPLIDFLLHVVRSADYFRVDLPARLLFVHRRRPSFQINNVLLIVPIASINPRLLLGGRVLYSILRCVNKSVSLAFCELFVGRLCTSGGRFLLKSRSIPPFDLCSLGVAGIVFLRRLA